MKYIAIILVLLLSACATNDYDKYAHAQEAIATSRATAETARYDALARIAETGDPQSKIAAVMAIAMGGQGNAQQVQQVAAPTPAGETALRWASVLIPGLTQVYGIQQNAKVAINSSNNAAAVAQSTNATFAGMGATIGSTAANGNQANIAIAGAGTTAMTIMAGKIQAPAANVTTTTNNTTTTTSLDGTGVLGDGGYSTSANQSLSGAGTIGSGSYDTPVSTSTSSTNAATTDTVDNHAVTTTTTTPAPVVVNTPVTPTVPVIVNPPVVVNPPTVITPVTPTVPVINQPVVVNPPVVVPDTVVIQPVTPATQP